MKIAWALVKERHPADSRSTFSVEKQGDEMHFEGGLLTVKTPKGRTLICPVGNIAWMEPLEPKAKK